MERERRASFKGYDVFIKKLSPEGMAELKNGGVISEICRNVNIWAQAYRGYKDEDSTYELITKLSEKIVDYAQSSKVNLEADKEAFVDGIYAVIDETFPEIK